MAIRLMGSILREHLDDIWAIGMAWIVWVTAQAAVFPPIVEKALENSAWAALVFFFVWTAWKREEKISARVEELEKQTPLLLREVLSAMERNSEAMLKLNESMDRLQHTVEDNQS